ncbi:ABC transporter ATP-binding protein/permease [Azospirillum sp. A1-3]|uniref:ABC transporter ATP-binding protein/permease n=1 Tax=Azospirillum sp. A1-3 TaxID=185874 RepID=UPI0020777882|nr:ABC transporter ATP-binding protein/permease [Azospirillum sp. A1-3]MCM8739276.1 ABC transporter ATP-binding protein/permease [Azospirillum sp. A1-3]
MTDDTDGKTDGGKTGGDQSAAGRPDNGAPGFTRRFLMLAGGYWFGRTRVTVWAMTVALVVLTIGQVSIPVLINLWSERLFDALEQRSMDRLMTMIGLVGLIIVYNIVIVVLHLRVKRRLQMGWRDWLTRKLLEDWLRRGRHHQIAYLPGEHDNPDGRIAEDIRITAEVAIDLGHSLTYCALLLVSFTNILWMLSGTLTVTVFGSELSVPGHLLYVALIYAVVGTSIAMLIGQPLVNAVNRRQGYEADFRFALARIRENGQTIALLHGESAERGHLTGLFAGVARGWNRQTAALANMMVFSASYSVLSAAFPILVAAPRYITGAITLGVLMQTAQAFQQTVGALSWPIDNLPRAAEWRASVERVLNLHDALVRLDREVCDVPDGHIQVVRADEHKSLTFTGVAIDEPNGTAVVHSFDLEVRPGDRVLIGGDATATIRLFRAVAGVWPWGRGLITLPAHTRVFFMPERPYLPHATLRAVLAYPGTASSLADDKAADALVSVGLPDLVDRLDSLDRWDEVLSVPERQRLGFARLLIRRPDWIFLEDATDSLDPPAEEELLTLMERELPNATLLTIGHHAGLDAHHGRKLVLERTNGAVTLREEVREVLPATESAA